MIRILTTDEPSAITISIDGELVGDYVEAVETSIHQAFGQQRPVHLFLRTVSQIDEQGRALLSRLASKGVELTASGVYSSYIVAEVLRELTKEGQWRAASNHAEDWYFNRADREKAHCGPNAEKLRRSSKR